jgi:hypothetical protein
MKVTLELEPDVELTATKQAEAEGLPLAKYVGLVLREAVFKNLLMRCCNRLELRSRQVA